MTEPCSEHSDHILHLFSLLFISSSCLQTFKNIHRNLQIDYLTSMKLFMQVSRLIEMQTIFYLEGVRSLHPYFRRQYHQEFQSNSATSLESRLSF